MVPRVLPGTTDPASTHQRPRVHPARGLPRWAVAHTTCSKVVPGTNHRCGHSGRQQQAATLCVAGPGAGKAYLAAMNGGGVVFGTHDGRGFLFGSDEWRGSSAKHHDEENVMLGNNGRRRRSDRAPKYYTRAMYNNKNLQTLLRTWILRCGSGKLMYGSDSHTAQTPHSRSSTS